MRCIVSGSSQLDPEGYECALCGGAPGVRSEECHVTDDTRAKLLANADDLKGFGITLEQFEIVQKSAGDKIALIGIGLQIAESLKPGVLRSLLLYLRDIAIPQEGILRLRLDEPERISEIFSDERERPKQSNEMLE